MGLTGGLATNGGQAASASSSNSRAKWLGLNGNSLTGFGATSGQGSWVSQGFVYDRLEYIAPAAVTGNTAAGTNVAGSIALGMTPIVLLEPSTYGTAAAIPSGAGIATFANYVVQAIQQLEGLYAGKGLLYEILNEPWTAGNYNPIPTAAAHADVVKGVIDACIAAGLDMTRIYVQAQHATYVGSMYTQQATLATLVQGWSVHPYGTPPPGYASSTGQGVASLPEFRKALGTGASNILVSEIGVLDFTVQAVGATSESTADTAADTQRWVWQIFNQLITYHDDGWLTAVIWYNRNSGGWATNASGGALTNVGTALMQRDQPPKSRVTGDYSAADDGYAAASMNSAAASAGILPTGGKLSIARIRVDERVFASKIYVHVTVAGATLTGSQNFAAIFDQLGNQYDITGDQSAVWNSTGRKGMTFGGDNFKPGIYYIAILTNGTTQPTFAGSNAPTIADGNGAVAPTLAMVGAATGLTAMPASLALASQTVSANLIWATLGT